MTSLDKNEREARCAAEKKYLEDLYLGGLMTSNARTHSIVTGSLKYPSQAKWQSDRWVKCCSTRVFSSVQ